MAGATVSNSTTANVTGSDNIAIGNQSMVNLSDGQYNIAIGRQALKNVKGITDPGNEDNSTGSKNVAIGKDAGGEITSGSMNIAVGRSALNGNTTGMSNIAVGDGSMLHAKGGHNVALGDGALQVNAYVDNNTAVGNLSLFHNAGTDNVAIGANSGSTQVYGGMVANRSVFIGKDSTTVTGSKNFPTCNDKLYIRNSVAYVPLIYGEFDKGKVGINTENPDADVDVAAKGNPGIGTSRARKNFAAQQWDGQDYDVTWLIPSPEKVEPEYVGYVYRGGVVVWHGTRAQWDAIPAPKMDNIPAYNGRYQYNP